MCCKIGEFSPEQVFSSLHPVLTVTRERHCYSLELDCRFQLSSLIASWLCWTPSCLKSQRFQKKKKKKLRNHIPYFVLSLYLRRLQSQFFGHRVVCMVILGYVQHADSHTAQSCSRLLPVKCERRLDSFHFHMQCCPCMWGQAVFLSLLPLALTTWHAEN